MATGVRYDSGHTKGFSMIEVAVAIAVIAILAGAAAPLVLKAINQQREQKTRDNLKIAFEAIFGAKERSVGNMRSDFAYVPPAIPNLAQMTQALGVRGYGPYAGIPLSGGWNGTYWTGAINSVGQPLDGWGRPVRLVGSLAAGFQLQSSGANQTFGGPVNDDLVYPINPAQLPYANATVTLRRIGAGVPTAGPPGLPTVLAQYPRFAGPPLGNTPNSVNLVETPPGSGNWVLPANFVPPGRIFITATIGPQPQIPPLPAAAVIPAVPGNQTLTYSIDVLPGNAAAVALNFN